MLSWIRGRFFARPPAARPEPEPQPSTPAAQPSAPPMTRSRSYGDSSLAPLIVAPWAKVTFLAFSFSEVDAWRAELQSFRHELAAALDGQRRN